MFTIRAICSLHHLFVFVVWDFVAANIGLFANPNFVSRTGSSTSNDIVSELNLAV